MHYWVDGKVYNKKELFIDLDANSLHYGLAIFEGILALKLKNDVILFRLNEHIERFFKSADLLGLDIVYSKDDIIKAIKRVVKLNGLNSYYIRPILFSKDSYLKLLPSKRNTSLAILLKPFNLRLFSLKMKIPISLACFEGLINPFCGEYSSLKASGRYLISALAKKHASELGYDDVVLFGKDGNITETSTANIFILKNNEIKTPPLDNVLDGITRKTVIGILSKMSVRIKQEEITKKELLNSDAAFITGSAKGIVSIKKIEKKKLNSSHGIIKELQERYIKVITGSDPNFSSLVECV